MVIYRSILYVFNPHSSNFMGTDEIYVKRSGLNKVREIITGIEFPFFEEGDDNSSVLKKSSKHIRKSRAYYVVNKRPWDFQKINLEKPQEGKVLKRIDEYIDQHSNVDDYRKRLESLIIEANKNITNYQLELNKEEMLGRNKEAGSRALQERIIRKIRDLKK